MKVVCGSLVVPKGLPLATVRLAGSVARLFLEAIAKDCRLNS